MCDARSPSKHALWHFMGEACSAGGGLRAQEAWGRASPGVLLWVQGLTPTTGKNLEPLTPLQA